MTRYPTHKKTKDQSDVDSKIDLVENNELLDINIRRKMDIIYFIGLEANVKSFSNAMCGNTQSSVLTLVINTVMYTDRLIEMTLCSRPCLPQ